MPLDNLRKILTTGLPEDDRLAVMLQQAMDEALRVHMVKLFSVMMQDPTEQPQRAMNGVVKAITAWRNAIRELKDPPA